MDGFVGVTAIDISAGAVTVSVVEPFTAPDAALIVLCPCATEVPRPIALIVVTLAAEELHVAVGVRSRVLLSL